MSVFPESFFQHLVGSVIYAVLGLIVFAGAFWIIRKISPFSVRKEIEEDQNVAFAIVVASVIIGIALVVAAAIQE